MREYIRYLKNFSIIRYDDDCRLAPAYDQVNTAPHVHDEDFALSEGLSPRLPRSDAYSCTGHLCRQDFEWFGKETGLVDVRVRRILDKCSAVPDMTVKMVEGSPMAEKLHACISVL